MRTRSPIFAQAFGLALAPRAPLKISTNRYPHSTLYHDGFVFLTSVGGNFGVSGDAKVEKFRADTGAKVGETIVGPYEPSPGVYANGCSGICFGAGSIWVAQQLGAGEVLRIDPDTMVIGNRIPIGGECRDVWWDGSKIWATVSTANKIVRIDPTTYQIDLTVPTLAKPFRGGFDGTHIWVACFDAGTVQKLDPVTGALVSAIATAGGPNAFWCETDRVFVSNYSACSITCIDPISNAILWTVETGVGSNPHGVILVGDELWICCSGDHVIRILNATTQQFVRHIAVPANPPWPCFDGANVWHPCGNANVLLRHPVRNIW